MLMMMVQERRLYMYVKYCENKPKSEYIVAEYIDYFEVCLLSFHSLYNTDIDDHSPVYHLAAQTNTAWPSLRG